MQMQDMAAAAPFMQIVYVLRHQGEVLGAALQLRQALVAGIGLGLFDCSQPVHVPLPDQPRIGSKALLRGQPLRVKTRP